MKSRLIYVIKFGNLYLYEQLDNGELLIGPSSDSAKEFPQKHEAEEFENATGGRVAVWF